MKYFAIINGNQQGPYELAELRDAGVMPDTYVWCKGMADWKQAKEVGDICRYFRIHIDNVMHPQRVQSTTVSPASETVNDDDIPQRYRHIILKSGTSFTPEQQAEDYSAPPKTWLGYTILLTLVCFPFTGFVAIYFAWKSSKEWNNRQNKESHESAKKSRMWTLLTLFFGFIFYAYLFKDFLLH